MTRKERARKSSRRQFLKATLITSTAGLAASACAPLQAPAPPAAAATPTAKPTIVTAGGTLTVGYYQQTSFSHFFHLHEWGSGEAIYNKQFPNAKLLTLNNSGTEFIPDLAEEWVFADDGRSMTFRLREGLTWHDGEPFTAEDVAYTFHQMSTPGMSARNRGLNWTGIIAGMKEWIDGDADQIEGISVVDDRTVTFDFLDRINPTVLFLAFNQVWMAPKHILGEYLDRGKADKIMSSAWATTAAHVGMGPFRVVEYIPDESVIYEPFENYYRGKPLLDRLIYRPFIDAEPFMAAMENRELDIALRLPEGEEAPYLNLDWLGIVTETASKVASAVVNHKQPYLADKRVRQALMYAIDRQAIVDNLFPTASVPECTVIGGIAVAGWGNSPTLHQYPYDPQKARQLLEEAGGWPEGQKLRWDLWKLRSRQEPWFAAIFGYWADNLGIETEYVVYGQDNTLLREEGGWDYDLAYSHTPLGHPVQLGKQYDARVCQERCVHYDNSRWQELLDKSMLDLGEEENKKVIWELQDIMTDEVLELVQYWPTNVHGVLPKVHGLETPALDEFKDWKLEKVWVE